MVEKFEDLELHKIGDIDKVEDVIKEKLGLSFNDMTQALSTYVSDKAEELTLEMVNIAPKGDYSKLLEDNDSMATYLKSEAHKPENWLIAAIRPSDVNKDLLQFEFDNLAIDDGDVFKGFVYVSMNGKIKYAFARGE